MDSSLIRQHIKEVEDNERQLHGGDISIEYVVTSQKQLYVLSSNLRESYRLYQPTLEAVYLEYARLLYTRRISADVLADINQYLAPRGWCCSIITELGKAGFYTAVMSSSNDRVLLRAYRLSATMARARSWAIGLCSTSDWREVRPKKKEGNADG